MTDQLVNEFVKRALNSGIPREKVAALVSKAQEIEFRNAPQKTAQVQLNNIVSNLLNEAGFDKNASSIAYTQGILKEALDNRISPNAAVKVAQLALAKTRANLNTANKLAEISKNAELADYAEGFIKAATSRGYTQEYATNYVINLIEKEKRAAGPGGQPPMPPGGGGAPGGGGMFKQPMPDPSSLGGPGGAPGGPGGQGGIPPELAALLGGQGGQGGQQIDPQMLEQILALISGGQGQGGPGGPPPQGPQGPAAGLAQQ